MDAIEAFVTPHVGTGRFVVTLTGEHTGALGAIRAHARRYPDLCVVQIDAHGDLRKAYQGNPYSHASVMARVVDDGLPLVQVGIRSISPEEIDRIQSTDRIATFFAAEILDPSGPYEGKASRWVPDVVKACRGPVYLTFDCDGLDASLVPALGTPEPGGLGWYDTREPRDSLGQWTWYPRDGYQRDCPDRRVCRSPVLYRPIDLPHVGTDQSGPSRPLAGCYSDITHETPAAYCE